MANTTRNTFQPNKNYKHVTAQRGAVFVDNELNELQDVMGQETAEGVRVSVAGSLASGVAGATAGTWARLVAEIGVGMASSGVANWEPVASGTADIVVSRGVAYADGWRITMAADASMVAAGLSFAAPGADTYGILYAECTFGEVDATADPTIATPQLGETTRRQTVIVQFKKAVSTVSYDAAMAGIANAASTAAKTMKQGSTSRFVICRWFQANAQAVINAADVVDMRTTVPVGQAMQTCFRVLRARQQYNGLAWVPDLSPGAAVVPDVAADGMVAWNAFEGRLILGTATSTAGNTRYDAGARIRKATSPKHNISNTTGVVRAQNGGATADGTQIAADITKGWLIGDEKALGYPGTGYTTSYPATGFTNYHDANQRGANHHFLHTLPSAIPSSLPRVGANPAPGGGAVPPVLVQQPVVATYASFTGGLGWLGADAFVICYRDGDDLVWWNGHVTRGTPKGWVLDSPNGESMSDSDVLVSSTGRGNLSQGDAVERALAFMTQGGEAGAFGSDSAEGRSLRIRVRKGVWLFTRKIHEYGLTTEKSNWYDAAPAGSVHTGSALSIIGDSPTNSELRVEPSVDAAETPALLNFNVGAFEMKGLTLRQDTSATANNPRYSLSVVATDILLEDCAFFGPVYLQARRIRVRNCRFYSLPTVRKTMANASFSTAPYVAQNLYAKIDHGDVTTDVSGGRHEAIRVEGCTFAIEEQFGTHGACILDVTVSQTPAMQVRVRDCRFLYKTSGITGLLAIPSVLVYGADNHIAIEDNEFLFASGVAKKGIAFVDGSVPFDGNFGASPIGYVGGAQALDGTSAAGTKVLSHAYITCTGPRRGGSSSSLRMEGNTFDLARVGSSSTATGRAWVMWGAFIHMPNPLSQSGGVYSGSSYTFSNILFIRNHVGMADTGITTWPAGGVDGKCPTTWGFYIAPTYQNNAGSVLDLQIQNVRVEDNTFNLGGSGALTTWRSIGCVGPNATVFQMTTTTKYIHDASCVIGIVLKKAAGVSYSATGRRAGGISIVRNSITQQSSPSLENAVVCDTYPQYMRFQPLMIHVASGDGFGQCGGYSDTVPVYTTGNVAPDSAGALTTESIEGANIAYNNIFAPALIPASDTGTTAVAAAFQGLSGGSVRDNTLRLGTVAGYTCWVELDMCVRTFVHGNMLQNALYKANPNTGNRLIFGENASVSTATAPAVNGNPITLGVQNTDYFLTRPRSVRSTVTAIAANASYWTSVPSGSSYGARCLDVSTVRSCYIPLSIPVGIVYKQLLIFVQGGTAGRAGFPGTRPRFYILSMNGFTTTVLEGNFNSDTAPADIAAYEAPHTVTMNYSALVVPPTDWQVPAQSLVYWLVVEGEAGVNAAAGYMVKGYELRE